MKRRTFAALAISSALALSLLSPGAMAQAPAKTLRMVAHADLKIIDPTFTTANISRYFGYMVYDTLFSQDTKGKPLPQMVEKYSESADHKQWTFTLRPGLKFSDGSAVTSADAIASLQRWASRDSMGGAMVAKGVEWKVVNPSTFTMTLAQPFGMVLEAISKPSGYPAFVLPERLAKLPTTSPITESLGSGPFIFKRDEWVPGNKAVFVRNPNYLPRTEAPDGLAGSKASKFDRVEWLYLPDANSAVAALQRGEVDYIELLPPDYITPLRANKDIKVGSSGSYQAFLIVNHLHPPFNNVKARQAFQAAVSQEKFLAAMGLPADMRVKYCHTFFICGSPNDTAAGSEAWAKPDLAKAKALLAESGYKGEKVVVLTPTDITYHNASALMVGQTLRSIGMNVDAQSMDWASVIARRVKRDAPSAGGWNVFVTVGAEFDVNSPISNAFLAPACGSSMPGWPCDKQLDELRTAWLQSANPAERKQRLDAFQARAFEVVPYINAGQYSAAYAARTNIKGLDKLWGGIPLVWMLDK